MQYSLNPPHRNNPQIEILPIFLTSPTPSRILPITESINIHFFIESHFLITTPKSLKIAKAEKSETLHKELNDYKITYEVFLLEDM